MKKIVKKLLCLLFLVTSSGCSTHHQMTLAKFNKLTPNYAPIKQGQIEYYDFGSGTPIVLIPGYATDVTSWNKVFLAALARQHRVIVLNNRNVGASYMPSRFYGSKELANDTYRLIQKLKLNKPTVIGISMGGMIAQHLAILHPECMSHLVLINTAIAGNKAIRPTQEVENKLRGLSKNKIGFYIAAVDLFFPAKWKIKMAAALATDRFQPSNYTEIDSARVIPEQQHLLTQWFDDDETANLTHTIRLPVLILNGKADIVIPPANSVILAKTIPHAKLVRWNEGGHAMIYQFPEEMGHAINQFIG